MDKAEKERINGLASRYLEGGEEEVFEELLDGMKPTLKCLMRVWRRIPGVDPEDLYQEMSLHLWRILRTWDPSRREFSYYADMALRSLVLTIYEQAMNKKNHVMRSSVPLVAEDDRGSRTWDVVDEGAVPPDFDMEFRETVGLAREFLRTILTPIEEAGILGTTKGLNIAETAMASGYGAKQMDNAVYRAHLKLNWFATENRGGDRQDAMRDFVARSDRRPMEEPSGREGEIPIAKNDNWPAVTHAVVSEEDIEWASQYVWRVTRSNKKYLIYRQIKVHNKSRSLYLDREIAIRAGIARGSERVLYHKNGDRLDCRRENLGLRIAKRSPRMSPKIPDDIPDGHVYVSYKGAGADGLYARVSDEDLEWARGIRWSLKKMTGKNLPRVVMRGKWPLRDRLLPRPPMARLIAERMGIADPRAYAVYIEHLNGDPMDCRRENLFLLRQQCKKSRN